MKSPHDSLHAGLAEHMAKTNPSHGTGAVYMLDALEKLTGLLIEGNTADKKGARRNLQKLIGRGRCILNASDFNKGLKKGQGSVCGNPAYAEPCTNPNAEECGDCLALPPVEGGTP